MNQLTIRKTKIYGEMGKEKSSKWFSFTEKKFITHVDTFYYSVKTEGDWSVSLGARSLVGALKTAKEAAEREKDDHPFMDDDVFSDLVVKPFFGFRMYKYGISKEGCFDIFIAENVPNTDTNAIVVQLRSQYIWLQGIQDAFYESLVYLVGILERYGIKISSINENRIDFAYHTNYIQDMLSFFKDQSLGQMQVSSFKRWSKEGNFLGDVMYNDYISLGRRKSNSVFIRIYNKSKEVIEMGYKQFFVPMWREQGLISEFDRYIFETIFDDGKQSWNYKEVARCKFYLEHGKDPELRARISELMECVDASVDDYKTLADLCVPDLTNVVNLEFQSKRKFFHDFRFPPVEFPAWVALYERRIYVIFQMLQSIREFLTHDTIRFVKYKGEFAKVRRERRPTADWWHRLSACRELDGISFDLCKEYQKKYDLQRCKYRSLSNIATMASLLEAVADQDDGEFDFEEDIGDILCYLNDNDMQRYSKMRRKKQKELKAKFG